MIYTIWWPHGSPTLSDAAHLLGTDVTNLNSGFGVLPIDAIRGEYAIKYIGSTPLDLREGAKGPFSNPSIDTFN